MCLEIDDSMTEAYKNKDVVIAYKVVYRKRGKLFSEHQYYEYLPGWNYSSRESKDLIYQEDIDNEVHEGIHVYLRLKDAKYAYTGQSWMTTWMTRNVVIKVKCLKENLVAAGYRSSFPKNETSEAVYTKVYLSPSEYARVKNPNRVIEFFVNIFGLSVWYYNWHTRKDEIV